MRNIIFVVLALLCMTYYSHAEKQWVQKHFIEKGVLDFFKVIDSTRIVALVGDGNQSLVYKSYDAGASWAKISEFMPDDWGGPAHLQSPESYIHDSLNYYICMLQDDIFYQTKDGGKTFNKVVLIDSSLSFKDSFTDFRMFNNQIGCALGYANIYWTWNNWETFETYRKPEKYIYTNAPIFFLDSNTIITKHSRATSNHFYSFNINTKEWKDYSVKVEAQENENLPAIWGLKFINDTLGYAAGAQKTNDDDKNIYYELIWKTTDQGVHWEIIHKELNEPKFGLKGMDFFGDLKGITCQAGKSMLTSDGGDTWTYTALSEEYLYSVFWACTYCGNYPIMHVATGGIFRYEEASSITEGIFEEIEVLKHQTSTTFTLEIQDPKYREYQIVISDMHGNKVGSQLLNTSLSNESKSLDLLNLDQEAYFYLITCNNSLISTGKFVNVR